MKENISEIEQVALSILTGKSLVNQAYCPEGHSTIKEKKANLETAKALGAAAAEAAKAKDIKMVVVDRGGNKYTGRVAAIVEACVAGGVSISSKTVKEAE